MKNQNKKIKNWEKIYWTYKGIKKCLVCHYPKGEGHSYVCPFYPTGMGKYINSTFGYYPPTNNQQIIK